MVILFKKITEVSVRELQWRYIRSKQRYLSNEIQVHYTKLQEIRSKATGAIPETFPIMSYEVEEDEPVDHDCSMRSQTIISIHSRKASEQVKWRSVICFYFDGYHFTGFWATPSNHHPRENSVLCLHYLPFAVPLSRSVSHSPSLTLFHFRIAFLSLFLNSL